MNAGLAILARDGRVLSHNRIWSESLERDPEIYVEEGFLRLSDSANQKRLTKLLSPNIRDRAQCSIALRAADCQVAKRLLFLPVGALADAPAVLGAPVFAAILLDPERTPSLDEDVAREWFGLTRAESAVAAHLLHNESIAGIAELLGISPHTVRAHMKSIFAKTGTSRQSSLVSVLLRLCASTHTDSRTTG
jgi:DNA-binding CsgD family transcriptional regulator